MALTKTPEKLKNSKVGTALGSAVCQKVVPIYPVRYSVAPSKKGSGDSFKNIKSPIGEGLPALAESEYKLRTLRPETYIYVYNENSDSKLSCFFYSKAHKGSSSPLFYYYYEDDGSSASKGGASNRNATAINDGNKKSFKIEAKSSGLQITTDDKGHDYIWVDCEKTKVFSKDVRMGVTDAFPSPRIWKKLKNDAGFREKLLPTIVPVKKWIDSVKTTKDSLGLSAMHNFYPDANDPKIKDTFFPSTISLQTHVLDFQDPDLSWSEIEQNTSKIGVIKAAMRIADKETHISVALHDSIGLASELNNIAAHEAKKVSEYMAENQHAMTSGRMITGYLKGIDSEEVLKAQIATEIARVSKERKNLRINPRARAHLPSTAKIEKNIREDAANQRAKMESHLRENGVAIEQEMEKYTARLKEKDKPIAKMVDDCLCWVDSKKPAYVVVHNALMFYDGVYETLEYYDDEAFYVNVFKYEETILHLFKALALTERGKKLLEAEILIKSPSDSRYWKALARGDKELWKIINQDNTELWEVVNKPLGVLESLGNVMSKVNDYGLNPFATDKLTALAAAAFSKEGALQSYGVQVNRLKTLIAVRYQGVIRPIIHTMTQVVLSEYALSWSVSSTTKNVNISKKLLDKINLETVSANVKNIGTGAEVVGIVSWEAASPKLETAPKIINHVKYTPAKNPMSQILKIVSSDKVGGGVAGAVSILSFFDLKKNLTNMVTTGDVNKEFWPVLSSASGFVSGVSGLIDVMPNYTLQRKGGKFNIQRLATTSTTKAASMALKVSIVAGAVSATAGAINDGIQSKELFSVGDNDSALWRMGASGMGLILAGASVMGGITAGVFGTGALATALAGALVLGPVGWAVVAFVALGALIYFTFKADGAKDTPVEIWLKRSYWGNHKSYNLIQENKAFEAVFYRPTVSADWNDDWGKSTDHLELTIFLPQYIPNKSKLTVIHSASLEGKNLQEGWVSKVKQQSDKFYSFNEKVISSGEGYMIKELTIVLDDDAQANIELAYQPNMIDTPDIKISGSSSGKAWTFQDDWLFGETIDSSEFAIIKDK